MTTPRALLAAALLVLSACSGSDQTPSLGAPSTIGGGTEATTGADAQANDDNAAEADGSGADADSQDAAVTDPGDPNVEADEVDEVDPDAPPRLELDDYDVDAPTLVDPGSEPHNRLRLQVPSGTTWQGTLAYDSSITQVGSDGSTGTVFTLPATEVDLAITADDVSADGSVFASFAYDRLAAIDDGTTEAAIFTKVEAAYAALTGPGGDLVLGPNGQLITAQQLIPGEVGAYMGDTIAELDRQADRLFVAFPTEPIGLGAVWEMMTVKEINSVPFETTHRFELTELNGDTYRVTLTTVEARGAEADVEASSSVRGSGEISGSLAAIGPDAASLTVSGSQTMDLGDGPVQRQISQSFTATGR